MMGVGPSLGTLVGTLRPTPTCAFWAHIVISGKQVKYFGEHIFVVQREDYVYLVPFVEDEQTVFLKTIIPSRKATRQYLGEESDDED